MKLFPLASYRKWLLGVAALTGGGILGLRLFIRPGYLNSLCRNVDFNNPCAQFWSQVVDGGFNEGYLLSAVLVVSFFLLFFSERAFKWWRWFAAIALSYGVWDIATTKTHDPGLFAGLGQSPQLSSTIDGVLFLVGSLLIAVSATLYNHFNSRGQK